MPAGARVGRSPARARPGARHGSRVRRHILRETGRPRLAPLRFRPDHDHLRLDAARRARLVRLRRRRRAVAARGPDRERRVPAVLELPRDGAGHRRDALERHDARRRLGRDPADPHAEHQPRAGHIVARGDDQHDRRRHIHVDEHLVVDRRQADELPVRNRDRLGDQEGQARPHAAQPQLRGEDRRVLVVVRRARREGRVEGLRHAELRQGPAGAGRARRARDIAGAVPRRAGRSPRLTLLGQDRFEEAARIALGDGVDAALVLAFHSAGGLTRFASSQIHQNTWRESVAISVMAVVDGNRVDAVRATLDAAKAIAAVTPANPDFPGLAEPASYPAASLWDDATAETTPAERADGVARAFEEFPSSIDAAGYIETTANEVFIAGSTGLRAYATSTQAGCSVMAIAQNSSGFAESVERKLASLDVPALAERAVKKAELGRDPADVEPGAYTVILEPAATSTLLQFLAFLGFGGKAFLEGRSFMTGKIGEKIMDDKITILDVPFDFEGTPSSRVILIDKGVAKDVVWDRTTAKKAGRESTGHGLPPPNTMGPLPLNLRMEPGDQSLEQLVASTDRGLLVTRFHYSNVVSEKETVLTGMTRDGTFAIEDGKIARGVKNLRFTQNAVEALSNVDGVGDTTETSTELFFGGSRAPAIKVRDFKFSSATTH
ncbi:MAG: TldD/PmbA family protein [Actinobacteria bacterium]|nr:MAG: TldD/PmbA family protein [Actinomycetota bacterium]